jgi:ankyrin repeat protein
MQPIAQQQQESVLLAACQAGNPQVVRLLIESAADATVISANNESVLHYAARSNQPQGLALRFGCDASGGIDVHVDVLQLYHKFSR